MSGFVTIDRSVFGHGFFPKEKMSEREAWIWIIQNAAWKDTQHRVGGKILPVPRGSFMTTLRELQAVFCWKSDTKVRNFLKRLEAERMIERTACGPKNAPKTHVTICNYEEYQTSGRTKNAPETHRTRHEKRSKGTSINNKQDTPNGVLAKRAKPKLSMPEDWVPDQSLAKRLCVDLDLAPEDLQFCYQQMKGHAHATDRKQVNWDQAFGNWVRKAHRQGEIGRGSSRAGNQTDALARFDLF